MSMPKLTEKIKIGQGFFRVPENLYYNGLANRFDRKKYVSKRSANSTIYR